MRGEKERRGGGGGLTGGKGGGDTVSNRDSRKKHSNSSRTPTGSSIVKEQLARRVSRTFAQSFVLPLSVS